MVSVFTWLVMLFAKDHIETSAKGAAKKYVADEEDEKDTVWYYCYGVYCILQWIDSGQTLFQYTSNHYSNPT